MRTGGGLALALVLASACASVPLHAPPVPDDAVVADLEIASPPGADATHFARRLLLRLFPDAVPAFSLLVDTGAEDSYLLPEHASALGLDATRLDHLSRLRVPTRLGRDLWFWTGTSRSLERFVASGDQWGGLLGADFLRHFVLEWDPAAGRGRLLDPARYTVPPQVADPEETVVRLDVLDNRPYVTVALNGRAIPMLVDTGASWSVVHGRTARLSEIALGVGLGRILKTLAGDVAVRAGEAASCTIGTLHLAPVPLLVSDAGLYGLTGGSEAVLGMDILERLQVRIDFPRRRMWLRVRKDAPMRLLGLRYRSAPALGVASVDVDTGHAFVLRVAPDSPAEALGLRAGDLVRADGAALDGLDAALAAIGSGGPLTVERWRDGAAQEIRLQRAPGVGPAPTGVQPDLRAR